MSNKLRSRDIVIVSTIFAIAALCWILYAVFDENTYLAYVAGGFTIGSIIFLVDTIRKRQ